MPAPYDHILIKIADDEEKRLIIEKSLPHIMINVKLLSRKETYVFESASPSEIYEKLGLYPTEWLAIYEGKIIPDDKVVETGEIVLIPVVSGG